MAVLTQKEFLQEIEESIENLESFLYDIVNNKKMARVKPLSVELRKLLGRGRGNAILKKAEDMLGRSLRFPDRSSTLPPKTIEVSLDDYVNRLIFALGGRKFTRIELIHTIANEKGAHTDREPDILHRQSRGILLPLGNPAKDKIFFEQNHRYLISIAKTVIDVVRKQILE